MNITLRAKMSMKAWVFRSIHRKRREPSVSERCCSGARVGGLQRPTKPAIPPCWRRCSVQERPWFTPLGEFSSNGKCQGVLLSDPFQQYWREHKSTNFPHVSTALAEEKATGGRNWAGWILRTGREFGLHAHVVAWITNSKPGIVS